MNANGQELIAVGEALYNLVFKEDLGSKFEAWKDALEEEQTIRLRLDIQAPKLMNVPWELLCDRGQFLALSNVSIVRYSDDSAKDDVELDPKNLKVLIVSASPNKGSFEEEAYINPVKTLFEKIDIVPDIIQGIDATRKKLLTQLDLKKYDLFHFIGHGSLEKRVGKVYLVDEENDANSVNGNELSSWLRGSGVKFAFFCSCQTGMTDEEHSFNGVARSMVRDKISTVVAMQYNLSQEEAKPIVESFYENLLRSGSVDEAMRFSRRNLSSSDVSWCVPALYFQLKEVRLVSTDDKDAQNTSENFELTLEQIRELKEEVRDCYQDNEDGLKNLLSSYKDKLVINYGEIPGSTPNYRIDYLIDQLYKRQKLEEFLDIARKSYPTLKTYLERYNNLLNIFEKFSPFFNSLKIISERDNKVFNGIDKENLEQDLIQKIDDGYMFQKSLPDSYLNLEKLSSYSYLNDLVEQTYSQILSSTILPKNQRDILKTWITNHFPDFEINHSEYEKSSHALQSYLLIVIKTNRGETIESKTKKFDVQAELIEDFNQEYLKTKRNVSVRLNSEDIKEHYSREEIPNVIYQYIDKVTESNEYLGLKVAEGQDYKLRIELFLPKELLTNDFDFKILDSLKDKKLRICEQYSLVLRSLDRLQNLKWRNNWLSKWKKFNNLEVVDFNRSFSNQNLIQGLNQYLENSSRQKKLKYKLERYSVLKITCGLPRTKKQIDCLFAIIVEAGLPLCLWINTKEIEKDLYLSILKQFDNLITEQALYDTEQLTIDIFESRKRDFAEDNIEDHLGYYLRVMYEHVDRIPFAFSGNNQFKSA